MSSFIIRCTPPFSLPLIAILAVITGFTSCNSPDKSTPTEEEAMAQPIADPIEGIRTDFQAIESGLANGEMRQTTEEESNGGYSQLTGYYRAGKPVKVVAEDIGGHGAYTTSCYLKDGRLFFVFVQEYSEASVNGPFTYSEKRAYLKDGAVIGLLTKEKITKSTAPADMSMVPNEDITSTIADPQSLAKEYISQCRDYTGQLKNAEKAIVFTNGRWISIDDPAAGIEIRDDRWIMIYNEPAATTETAFTYAVSRRKASGTGPVTDYLTLKRDNELLEYVILDYNEETLSLSYLPRGNTLTYKRAG